MRIDIAGACFALLCMTCLPVPGVAQDAGTAAGETPPTQNQVTVTGRREGELRHLDQVVVPQFLRAHGALAAETGQLARWRRPLCVQTTGLSGGFNAFVTRRVKEVAASIGAAVSGDANCTPNVLVLFTTQPQQQLDEVVRDAPTMLGSYYPAERAHYEVSNRTIQAWYMTTTRGESGEEVLDSTQNIRPGGMPGSRLTSSVTSQIVHVLIIADAKRTAGYTVGSVADYIAMLALAQQASLDECGELPSITDLMALNCRQSERAEELTVGDLGYLQGLYSADLMANASIERSEIHAHMMQALAGTPNPH